MTNNADPDQWPTDLDLHCLQRQVYPGSAGPGLKYFFSALTVTNYNGYTKSPH